MVQRVVDDAERRKAEALAQSERRVHEARTRLDELESFRAAYVRDFNTRAQAGFNGAAAREYQMFLGRLEEALHHQGLILAQAETQRGAELESWRGAARRAAAVDTLARNWRAEELRAEDQREQHDTDERSLQQWTRRSQTRVT